MPNLTPKELEELLAEYDKDQREAREQAAAQRQAAQREREEFLASQDDIVADLLAPTPGEGPTPRVARLRRPDAIIEGPDPTEEFLMALDDVLPEPRTAADEPNPWAEPRRRVPWYRPAMQQAFRANYGMSPRDQLITALNLMADYPVAEETPAEPPPLNSVWYHERLTTLQFQVTRVDGDMYTVRPIGTYRTDLPRTVQIPHKVFYTWLRYSTTHVAIEIPEDNPLVQRALKRVKQTAGPKPPSARSALSRLIDDSDDFEDL
jgi:hypothetical protein